MNLSFSKSNGWYEANATITGDFNLRLVRENEGVVEIWGTTKENGDAAPMYEAFTRGNVFEKDFKVIVAPKYLTIKSSVNVTSGEITFA